MGSRVIPTLVEIDELKQGSISFLKKRNKKLLSVAPSTSAPRLARRLHVTNKSFLVLFFKKEQLSWHLPCFGMPMPRGARPR
jgi:hypothetical protein